MGPRLIFLLFFITVLNLVPSTKANTWSWVISELGRLEHLNLSAIISESNSTQSELKTNVIFYLYTKSSQDTPEVIYLGDDEDLSLSSFDASLPTRIIIHGWQSSSNSTMAASIGNAYLEEGTYNIIAVDWSAYADGFYVYAGSKVVAVGSYVGQMIDYFESEGMSLDDLIVIGHSLGAHIAGVACRSANNTVASLIGLDPAGPLFYGTDIYARMRATDAAFVEVIHTNAGELGYNGNLGVADFWPNGGTKQPGCGIDIFGSCSHGRSYVYFAESIASNSTKFVSQSCVNYISYLFGLCSFNKSSYMDGSTLDTTAHGDYYLRTNAEYPYAQG